MSWWRARLTKRRLALIAAILAVTTILVVVGTPLSHPTTGSQETGERGIGGSGRVVEVAAILIAFILAWPPGGHRQVSGQAEDDEPG